MDLFEFIKTWNFKMTWNFKNPNLHRTNLEDRSSAANNGTRRVLRDQKTRRLIMCV